MKHLKIFILIILFATIICTANTGFFDPDEVDDSSTILGKDNFDIYGYSSQLDSDFLLINNIVDFALNHLIGKTVKNQIVGKKKLNNFLVALATNYNSNSASKMNPYHNLYHAADVVHTLFLFLINSKEANPILFKDTYTKQLNELQSTTNIKYNDLDIFALIIAAACHDYKHPGRNNDFYSTYRDKVPFAKELKKYDYNLEKYHFAEAKKLIEEFDLLEYLNNYQKDRFYKIMKMVIEATDNSLNAKHAENMMDYKELIQINSKNVTKGEIINLNKSFEQLKVKYPSLSVDDLKILEFECLLHAADISNPTKIKKLFLDWSLRINEELCLQSKEINSIDKTKEIDCIGKDEKKFRNSQLQFFEYVVEVFFRPFCEVFGNLNYLCSNYEKNKQLLKGNAQLFTFGVFDIFDN